MTQVTQPQRNTARRETIQLRREVQRNRQLISDMRRERLYNHSITILSTISFVVGGTLIARTIWEFVFKLQGPVITILLGVVMLSFGGIILHKFDKDPS